MTRDTYDVTDPDSHDVVAAALAGQRPDPERGPHAPDLPACPHCGGGPPVDVPSLGLTCKSCARVLVVRVRPLP